MIDDFVNLQQAPSLGETLIHLIPIFVVVFLIFYFIVILPSSKEQKQKKAMLESLKKGDTVLLSNGFLVKFVQHEEPWAIVELAPNVRVKVEKSAIVKMV